MMSQTAPAAEAQHKEAESLPYGIKDNAFVSVYNDDDITELLYKESAFASGFLPLEPDHAKPTPVTIPKRRLAAHFNTGTTPPTRGFEQRKATNPEKAAQTPIKSNMRAEIPQPKTAAKVVERRPSFIEVSTPSEHKEHHGRRRHSSENHVTMGWWPEDDMAAQHVWVEKDQTSADEEEDILEDCTWTDAFYD